MQKKKKKKKRYVKYRFTGLIFQSLASMVFLFAVGLVLVFVLQILYVE